MFKSSTSSFTFITLSRQSSHGRRVAVHREVTVSRTASTNTFNQTPARCRSIATGARLSSPRGRTVSSSYLKPSPKTTAKSHPASRTVTAAEPVSVLVCWTSRLAIEAIWGRAKRASGYPGFGQSTGLRMGAQHHNRPSIVISQASQPGSTLRSLPATF